MDISSKGRETLEPGFHLKIYQAFCNRYLALACPASDSKTLKFLHHALNSAIMKNIFHQSFNAYKMDIEPRLNKMSLHHVQCSKRHFEIMSHQRVTAAFIEGENVVVTVEGEAARVLNFDTGCPMRCFSGLTRQSPAAVKISSCGSNTIFLITD
ncbi:hypothetical protein Y1Q_0010297 [Alligator mississippiensis]|uniref:Uncharacterized protein n=1 Tax=Alligator mississippiensis TaxID=8496 RepID=A0A151NMA3_ALLMI|nr:hypothetical protein Y1Q_0010297 [Alligator mississippiensis]